MLQDITMKRILYFKKNICNFYKKKNCFSFKMVIFTLVTFFIGPKRKLFWETTVSTFSTSLCLLFPNSFYKNNTWCWKNNPCLRSLNHHIRNYFKRSLHFCTHAGLKHPTQHCSFTIEVFITGFFNIKKDISLGEKVTPWFLTAHPRLLLLCYSRSYSSNWM